MGKGQSKQKGGKKGKGSKEEAAPASSSAAAAAPVKNEAVEAPVEEEEDIDWDAPTLYAKNNKKVGVEDFELLKVIGKGSFGKVLAIFPSAGSFFRADHPPSAGHR